MGRDLPHTPRRQGGVAQGEGAEQKLEGARGDAQVGVEEDAAEKGLEETFQHSHGETACLQVGQGGGLRTGVKVGDAAPQAALAQPE